MMSPLREKTLQSVIIQWNEILSVLVDSYKKIFPRILLVRMQEGYSSIILTAKSLEKNNFLYDSWKKSIEKLWKAKENLHEKEKHGILTQ